MDKRQTILAADDSEEIQEIIQVLLESEGYDVILASDGKEAVEKLTPEVDLIILDVMMPELSGLKACLEMRKSTNAPILFLTAKSMDSDKALGFSSGGDDYLVKPFSASELVCRVKALLRRYQVYQGQSSRTQDGRAGGGIRALDGAAGDSGGTAEAREMGLWSGDAGNRGADGSGDSGRKSETDPLYFHEWKLDPLTFSLFRGSEEVAVTDIEFRILFLLAKHRGKIFSVQNLYESVWEEPYYYTAGNTLMVHIRNLRKKIEADPGNPRYLVTVWGKGYRCV